jgi:hypothetical protein
VPFVDHLHNGQGATANNKVAPTIIGESSCRELSIQTQAERRQLSKQKMAAPLDAICIAETFVMPLAAPTRCNAAALVVAQPRGAWPSLPDASLVICRLLASQKTTRDARISFATHKKLTRNAIARTPYASFNARRSTDWTSMLRQQPGPS